MGGLGQLKRITVIDSSFVIISFITKKNVVVECDALLGPGVNPLEGSPNVKLQKVGTEGTLPVSNSRKGQRVELGAPGLNSEEGLEDQA